MVPTHVEELIPGRPFPHALYTRAGRLLAHSGTLLTPEMGAFLEPHKQTPLLMDTRAEPLGVRPDSGEQVEGSVLSLTDAAADADRVAWERRLIRTRAELRRAAGALVQVARVRWERLPLRIEIGLDPVVLVRAPDADGSRLRRRIPTEEEASLRERRASGVTLLGDLLARLLEGESLEVAPLYDLAADLTDALVHHPELYAVPAMGLPRPCDSLPEHCFSTGAIALGIAAMLGWPRADVFSAAIAGFLCDSGLSLVPHPIRDAGRPLTDVEVNSVRRHPEYSVALLRAVRGVPEHVVLGAFQHQERCDGSGYPHGIGGGAIHDLAKVLAVADSFAGMTSPRIHRPALTAHAAMSELARQAGAGVLDKTAVAALIDLFGLYPARSFVRLNTGHVALVGAAASPPANDRPVVHVVQPAGSPVRFGRGLDLARIAPRSLRIVEAIRTPDGVEV